MLNSQFQGITSQFWEEKMKLWDIKSELQEKKQELWHTNSQLAFIYLFLFSGKKTELWEFREKK